MNKSENDIVKYTHQQSDPNGQSDITDYIPRHVLQEVQDSLTDVLHVPLLFASRDGKPITRSAVLSTFCYRFVYKSNARRPCLHCQRFATLDSDNEHTNKEIVPSPNDCPTGLCDVTIPITLGTNVLGYLITSQIIGTKKARISAYKLLRQNGMDSQTVRDFLSRFPTTDTEVIAKIGRSVASIVTVISSLAATDAANARLAIYDALTGLYNCAYMWQFLDNKITLSHNAGKPFAVIILDLDGFKNINDTHGHRAGDAVLQAVAKSLIQSIRPGDLPTRFGGDEFVIVLDNVGKKRAEAISQRIQEAIAKVQVMHNGQLLNVATSAGIAVFSRNCDKNSEQLFAAADRMLYRDKNGKKLKSAA